MGHSSLPVGGDSIKEYAMNPGIRRTLWWAAICIAAIAMAAGIWYAVRPDSHGAAPANARGGRRGGAATGPVPVAVAAAARRDIQINLDALGTVTPLATVTIQTQVSGQLVAVGFKEGQPVKKGELLAEIDPRPYQAALDQALGQLVRDQASLSEAAMDLTRYEQLAAKNSINRQQAEDQKWIVAQDEGAVKIDQAQVTTARINLAFCRIVSPTDGRIGLRLVDPGNVAQVASNTPIAVITQTQPTAVVFVLAEDDLPSVTQRLGAGATLQAQAYDRTGATLLDTGSLKAIDSQINTSTGTVNLKAEFPNRQSALFPNQFVNVVLHVNALPGATAVPSAAIQRGSGGSFVYLVRPNNTVAMTPVKLGPTDAGQTALLSGIVPGDRVVIDGADKLRDGAPVAVRDGT